MIVELAVPKGLEKQLQQIEDVPSNPAPITVNPVVGPTVGALSDEARLHRFFLPFGGRPRLSLPAAISQWGL